MTSHFLLHCTVAVDVAGPLMQVVYVDQVVVFAGGVATPTPAPGVAATPAPGVVNATPAPGVVTATPAPGVAATPGPVAAPVSVPVGAAFVMKISGGEITETQMGGGPIAVSIT